MRRTCSATLLVFAACAAGGPGVEPSLAVRELELRAPLSVPRPSFFHAALLVPPLQSAAVLPVGSAVVTASSNHTGAKSYRTFDGRLSWFSGSFHEWFALDARAGAAAGIELSVRSAVSGWDEAQDHFTLVDTAGNLIVRDESRLLLGEATQRHENVARLDLGTKFAVAGGDGAQSAIAAQVKLPVARPGDLTNAGTVDLAATLLQSLELGAFTLHAEVGEVWPTGSQNLFEASADLHLNPFAHGAVGATWRAERDLALDLQLQGNTSAFRDVPFFAQGPVTLVAGGRLFTGREFVELGVGAGFDRARSDWWELFVGFGVAL